MNPSSLVGLRNSGTLLPQFLAREGLLPIDAKFPHDSFERGARKDNGRAIRHERGQERQARPLVVEVKRRVEFRGLHFCASSYLMSAASCGGMGLARASY
jgi:hypothetical protein